GVGKGLHAGSWAVVVVPADIAHELLAQTVAPQPELVRLDGVHAELDAVAAAAPLRPRVAQQAVGQQPERHRAVADGGAHPLGTEPGPAQANLKVAGRQVRVHRAGSPRLRGSPQAAGAAELQLHTRQGRVLLVADKAYQHRSPPSPCWSFIRNAVSVDTNPHP